MTAANELLAGATVAVRIASADLAQPPAAVIYNASFTTAAGLYTTAHAPELRTAKRSPATPSK